MSGTEFLDLGLMPALLVALVAGVLSFLSPCVLPIVPPYLAYMSGITVTEMGHRASRAILPAVFFVLGLSTVFMLLGFAASALGRVFLSWQGTLSTLAGIVVMVFGAHFLGVFRLSFMDRDLRIDAGQRGGTAMGAYLLGLAFAFGWTPCIGPILGAILTIAAAQAEVARGSLLLAAYALGLGLPFLLVAAFFPRLTGVMAFLRRHMGRIEKIMGLLLWTVGLMMATGQFADLSFWLLENVPVLSRLG